MSEEDEILDRPIPLDDANLRQVHLRIRRKLPGRRLDSYLHARFPHLSRTAIQRLIKQGAIKVNEKPSKPSYEMCAGDVIELTIPNPEPPDVVPQPIPIDVVWEDDYLVAINKQAGIVCHPAHREQTGTLVNGLAYHYQQLSAGSDPFRPGIVHRLDKNTTGIMLVAKSDEAHWRLAMQFERRTVEKTYLAVVEGPLELDGDVIDAPIGMHPIVREKFAVMVRENKIDIAKPAVTAYEVAERFQGYTLVKLFPKTGRTHQLRVHMSHIGHPIAGDTLYKGKIVTEHSLTGSGSDEPIFPHQALHAWRIRFQHPIFEKPMELEAPFPDPLRQFVALLRRFRRV